MDNYGWVIWIVTGGLAGLIAEKIMGFNTGLIMNIVLGIVGSVVANAVLRMTGIFPSSGFLSQLIVAVIGACLLIYAYRLINSRR